MVHRFHTGVLQAQHLLLVEQAEAGAHFEIVFLTHGTHGVEHLVEHRLAGRAAGDHHAQRAGLQLRGAVGRFHDLFLRHHRVLLDFGGGDLGLRAVATVFRTESALRIQQEVQPHAITPRGATHAIGCGQLVEQLLIRSGQHGMGLFTRDDLTSQGAVSKELPVRECG